MQIDQLNEVMGQKPAAIVLLPVDGYAVIPVVEKVNAAQIPLIATNRDLNGGQFAHVMSDESQAGRLQGEYMAKHLPPNAQIVYFMGESSQKSAVARWEGFKAACLDKRPDIQLLAKADANWSEAEGLKDMTLWLQIYPQIDAVVCGNDNMALGALHALKAAGKSGVLISGVDAVDDALKAVAAGDMSQTVKQDADKTAEAIAGLLQKSLSGTAPTDDVKVPFTEITRDNISQFR
jgi:inositol transport system substrate-binding protein